jgi:hypothetical protein
LCQQRQNLGTCAVLRRALHEICMR